MNDAGRVMILPKGKYSATVQYDKLDSVTHNGSAWVATQSTIGNEPADDSDYWILFVKGGGVTADGTSLEMDADGVLGIKDGVIPDVDGSTIVKDDNNIIRIADALKKLIDGAVQEVAGKGLSTNDFTDTLLQKLNGIAEGANNYSLPDATSSIKGGVILSNSEAVTDSTGMALPATEKNASLEGTLANKISELNSNLSDFEENYQRGVSKISRNPFKTFQKIVTTKDRTLKIYVNNLNEINLIRIREISFVESEGYYDSYIFFRLTSSSEAEIMSQINLGSKTPTITVSAVDNVITINWTSIRAYIPVIIDLLLARIQSYAISLE